MSVIRAALVENMTTPHRVYRRILEHIPGVELVAAFHFPEELLAQLYDGLRLDVIVMDIRMDEDLTGALTEHLDGIEAARRIRFQFPKMPIVLYSMWENPDYYRRIEAARLGTRYAFVKRHSLDDWDRMGEIMRMVIRGDTYIDLELRIEWDLLKGRRRNSPLERLENDEQRKVLALLADGLSNAEIGHALGRGTRWVEDTVGAIYLLLGLSGDGGGDSRRIRAAIMFKEDRLLSWEKQADDCIVPLALNHQGNWLPLQEVQREEQELMKDVQVINNNT